MKSSIKWTRLHWTLLLAAMIFLSPSRAIGAASGSTATPQPVAVPSDIAAMNHDLLCIANATSGIDAINLKSGKKLWSSTQGGRPLLISDNRLFLLGQDPATPKGSLQLFVIDTRSGKQLLQSQPMAGAIISSHPGGSCTYQTTLAENDLLLNWIVRTSYWGGAVPTKEVLRNAQRTYSYSYKINLKTGSVKILEADFVQSTTSCAPENYLSAPIAPQPLPKKLEGIKSSYYLLINVGQIDKPLAVAGKIMVLDKQHLPTPLNTPNNERLVLKSWDSATGEHEKSTVLMEGKNLFLTVTPDGRFLFVLQAIHKENLPEAERVRTIFSLVNAGKIGTISYDEKATPLGIYEGAAIFIRDLTDCKLGKDTLRVIEGYNTRSGKLLWRYSIAPARTFIPPC